MIETKRLILKDFDLADAQAIFDNWSSDPSLASYTDFLEHFYVEDTVEMLELWQAETENRVIRKSVHLKESGEPIGTVDVMDNEQGVAELSYIIGSQFAGHGYATEACKALIDYIFKLRKDDKIIVAAMENNRASLQVIRKLGFKYKETKTRFIFTQAGITNIKYYVLENTSND